jgi:hypothetical protein
MLHVNELESDKHLHGSYLEFLEAFARACDEASIGLYPEFYVGEDGKSHLPELDDELKPTISERRMLPLHLKLENSIPYLLHNCTSKTYRDNFVHPRKHPRYGLYILPNGKFF